MAETSVGRTSFLEIIPKVGFGVVNGLLVKDDMEDEVILSPFSRNF